MQALRPTERGGICPWSKTQATVSLSSGEAELNSAAKGISDCIGVYNAAKELFAEDRLLTVCVDASACKAMLLRT